MVIEKRQLILNSGEKVLYVEPFSRNRSRSTVQCPYRYYIVKDICFVYIAMLTTTKIKTKKCLVDDFESLCCYIM